MFFSEKVSYFERHFFELTMILLGIFKSYNAILYESYK
jgi:hypothetical protein